uniref:Mediator of RNA polymerase II transcription subunit 15 n=1 Tax=Capra hircus TaxID=9925 RepID=A0A8C2RZG6_CAPHI
MRRSCSEGERGRPVSGGSAALGSEDAMRKAGVAHSKSSKDMESHVFLKAKTRDEYLSLVARLIIHFRDIHNKKSQASVSGKSFSFLKFFPTSEWVAGPGCRELWAGSLCWEKQVPRGTPLPPLTPPPGRPVPSLLADSLAVEACLEW